MIECIFTLDYEIYGNGEGDLRPLVLEPTELLLSLFRSRAARFVLFVEAAELEAIEAAGSDPAISAVKDQVCRAHSEGFEIALHLHPQWCNASHRAGRWRLDTSEYNLCTLPRPRMVEIVDRSIDYLRRVLADPGYTPLSFRAGNWLFQPTAVLAQVLAEKGIKVDSSVYKGGLQRELGLDYRRALGNGDAWWFKDDVNLPDTDGILLEIPTYTEQVAPWTMATRKRLGFGGKGRGHQSGGPSSISSRLWKALDVSRLRYPLKLDFCRMTSQELLRTIDRVVRVDGDDPSQLRPIVAIGHTKDLIDYETVERFLDALQERGIPISTLQDVYPRLHRGSAAAGDAPAPGERTFT